MLWSILGKSSILEKLYLKRVLLKGGAIDVTHPKRGLYCRRRIYHRKGFLLKTLRYTILHNISHYYTTTFQFIYNQFWLLAAIFTLTPLFLLYAILGRVFYYVITDITRYKRTGYSRLSTKSDQVVETLNKQTFFAWDDVFRKPYVKDKNRALCGSILLNHLTTVLFGLAIIYEIVQVCAPWWTVNFRWTFALFAMITVYNLKGAWVRKRQNGYCCFVSLDNLNCI